MKLSQFFEKSKSVKKASKQVISFVNETKEAQFKEEVLSAQNKTTFLEKENNELQGFRATTQQLTTEIQEIKKREDVLKQKINLRNVEVERMQKRVSNHTFLENQITQLTTTTQSQKSGLEKAIDLNSQLNINIDKLTKQVSSLTTNNESLRDSENTANIERIRTNDRMESLGKKFDEAVKIFDATQVKYKEGLVNIEELQRKLGYWNAVADTMTTERDQLKKTEGILNNITSTLDSKYSNQKGMTKLQKAEITKLTQSVSQLTLQIKDLTETRQTLAQENAYLKEALSRPRYATMSMIEKSEGFKMPMGGSRKHFLGTGKPTLLKFEKEGSVA